MLCEKPLSRHPAEVEAAFDAAERAGRFLMEAFMWRHNPQTARLVELVESGAIGELRLVRSAFSYSLYDHGRTSACARARGRRADGRRLLLRQRLAPARGRARASRSAARSSASTRHRLGLRRARCGFPATSSRQFDCGTALPDRDELEAIGTEGSLFLDDPWHCRKPGIELRRGGEVERSSSSRSTAYRLELENLSAAIRGEAEPLLGRADALAQARAIEALFRSAELGCDAGCRPGSAAAHCAVIGASIAEFGAKLDKVGRRRQARRPAASLRKRERCPMELNRPPSRPASRKRSSS